MPALVAGISVSCRIRAMPLSEPMQVVVSIVVSILVVAVVVSPFIAIAYVLKSLYKNRRRKPPA